MKKTIASLFALLAMLRLLNAFEVTVTGLYFEPGETPPTYTLVSLGGDSVQSTWADSYADWIQVPPFEDENGDPVDNWEIVAGSQRTAFTFDLSGDWAGRQVALVRDGGQTNFVHFYFGGLGFNEADFSGAPSAPAPSVTMLGNYFTIGRLINGATEEYPLTLLAPPRTATRPGLTPPLTSSPPVPARSGAGATSPAPLTPA